MAMLRLGTMVQNPIVAGALQNLTAFKTNIDNNPAEATKTALQNASVASLMKILHQSTNEEKSRLKLMSKVIFEGPTSNADAMISQMGAVNDTCQELATVSFMHSFMSDAGSFDWERYKRFVSQTLADKAAAVGAQQARQGA